MTELLGLLLATLLPEQLFPDFITLVIGVIMHEHCGCNCNVVHYGLER